MPFLMFNVRLQLGCEHESAPLMEGCLQWLLVISLVLEFLGETDLRGSSSMGSCSFDLGLFEASLRLSLRPKPRLPSKRSRFMVFLFPGENSEVGSAGNFFLIHDLISLPTISFVVSLDDGSSLPFWVSADSTWVSSIWRLSWWMLIIASLHMGHWSVADDVLFGFWFDNSTLWDDCGGSESLSVLLFSAVRPVSDESCDWDILESFQFSPVQTAK